MKAATKKATEKPKRKRAALDATRVDAFAMEPEKLVIVGLDTDDTVSNSELGKYLYDERILLPLDPAKVANVARFGVRKQVVVWLDGDRAIVVDGRQRARWARAANEAREAAGEPLMRVPVSLARGSLKEMHELMLALNSVTETDSPIARARGMQRLVEMGYSANEIGLVVGMSAVTVAKNLKLLDLSDEVQAKVTSREVTIEDGAKLARLPRAEQGAAVKQRQEAKRTGATRPQLPGERLKPPGRDLIRGVARHLGMKAVSEALAWSLGDVADACVSEFLRAAIEKARSGKLVDLLGTAT